MEKILAIGCYSLLHADGDKPRYLKQLGKIANVTSIWADIAWGKHDFKDGPFQYLRDWKTGYFFEDKKDVGLYPFFDILLKNIDYWARLHDLMGIAAHYIGGVWMDFEDSCSLIVRGPDKYLEAFYSFTPDYDPEKGHVLPGGIWDDSTWQREHHQRFWRWCWDEVKAHSFERSLITFQNEFSIVRNGYADKADAVTLKYGQRAIDYCASIGIAKSEQAITYPPLAGYIAPGYFSYHGVGNGKDVEDKLKQNIAPAARVIMSTDGCKSNYGDGKYGPSADEALDIAKTVMRLGCAGVEHWDAKTERGPAGKEIPVANVDFAQWEVYEAFAKGLQIAPKTFVFLCPVSSSIVNDWCPEVTWPSKFIEGQQPTDICLVHHAPTPEPEPQPQPEPVKPLSLWEKFRRWIRKILGIDKGPGK